MSKVAQKKSHWTAKVNECAICKDSRGEFNVQLRGGAENGEFAYVGPVNESVLLYKSGKLTEGELLLEVETLSVSGLPLYDVLNILRNFNGPVRLKTVRQVYPPLLCCMVSAQPCPGPGRTVQTRPLPSSQCRVLASSLSLTQWGAAWVGPHLGQARCALRGSTRPTTGVQLVSSGDVSPSRSEHLQLTLSGVEPSKPTLVPAVITGTSEEYAQQGWGALLPTITSGGVK
ncbi:hypothetical protein P4O66_000427 [Electrophorus voltai]|uniref:PDZ domain-containing protein n=1 Tax=Electrophorus voltai TaxID=2609070 RepID=A0AAD9DZ98_9TELE|nr:hypothetical protein P4O66_000427 [Electrophorus voltai]